MCFSLKTQGEELFAPLSEGLILCPCVVFENVFHDSRYSRKALPQFGCPFFSEVTRVGTFLIYCWQLTLPCSGVDIDVLCPESCICDLILLNPQDILRMEC